MTDEASLPPKRNRGFDATHETIIAATVELISKHGKEGVSVSAVARRAGLDRKTMYYHFKDRDALLASAKAWASSQLAEGLVADAPRMDRTTHISTFVLDNPQLIKLWIDDFVSPGDIRERYPEWDRLVDGMKVNLASEATGIDAEVYCAIMLTAAFIAPRVYRNSIRPDLSESEIVERFTREQMRTLGNDARRLFVED